MKIYNARVFIDGKFIDGGAEFEEKIISCGKDVVMGDKNEGDVDAGGDYLIPGLIDIHSHGAMNQDVSDGKEESMPILGRYYASRGVTSWCPATMTLSEETLERAFESIRDYERPIDGARAIGINMEGPFLSSAKRGSQDADFIHVPDVDMFKRLYKASGETIKIVTVAPEEPNSIDFIKEVSKLSVVSLGHTTADYDTALSAFDAGASHVTHLFNAMPPLMHRAPGVIGAAFDAGATVELICDGFHIHPAVVRLAWAAFGEKMVLVSDSLSCAGMPEGEYTLGGTAVTYKDGRALVRGTNTIAASTIHLMDGFLRTVTFGIPLEKVVEATTIVPARVIKMDDQIGSISPGNYADLVLLDSDLNIKAVYIEGKKAV